MKLQFNGRYRLAVWKQLCMFLSGLIHIITHPMPNTGKIDKRSFYE